MENKQSIFILLGAILLYSFHSYVESHKKVAVQNSDLRLQVPLGDNSEITANSRRAEVATLPPKIKQVATNKKISQKSETEPAEEEEYDMELEFRKIYER